MVATLALCVAFLLIAPSASGARGHAASSCEAAKDALLRLHGEDTSAPFMPLDAYLRRARATMRCYAAAREEARPGDAVVPEANRWLTECQLSAWDTDHRDLTEDIRSPTW